MKEKLILVLYVSRVFFTKIFAWEIHELKEQEYFRDAFTGAGTLESETDSAVMMDGNKWFENLSIRLWTYNSKSGVDPKIVNLLVIKSETFVESQS